MNSLSLKDGEERFVEHARRVRRHGAAIVVMAFDEQGQADTVERKVEILTRAYGLLVDVRRRAARATSSSTRAS